MSGIQNFPRKRAGNINITLRWLRQFDFNSPKTVKKNPKPKQNLLLLSKEKWHREHNTIYQALQAEGEEILRCNTFQGNNGTDQVETVCFQKVKKGLRRTDLAFLEEQGRLDVS